MNRDVLFNMRVVDNMSPTFERVAASEHNYAAAANTAKASTDSQNISFIAQMTAVAGLYMGIGRITSGMQSLGIISDGTAAKLMKVHAAVGIVAGAFSVFKSAIAITKALAGAEAVLAAIETYRSVLKNPIAAAGVAVGLAATAAVGGASAYGIYRYVNRDSGGTTVNQTVNMNGPEVPSTVRRSQARAMYEVEGGF